MHDFNLDLALREWRQRVVTLRAPEAEDLAELEAGLLDRYDANLICGLAPAAAFAAATERLGLSFAPSATEPSKRAGGWSLLTNYLKVAWRNLRARRWYNLTNFLVLSVGIITATLALLYYDYETSYDAHLLAVDRKFRVGMNLRAQGYSTISFPDFNGTTAAVQQQQIAGFAAVDGVRSAVQFVDFAEATLVTFGDGTSAGGSGAKLPVEHLLQSNTPAAFLDYFGVSVLAGQADAFSADLNTALLTESLAERYYGADWRTRSFTDEVLRIDTTNYAIAGVVADPAPNLHFTYSLLLHQAKLDYWGCRTYLKLVPGADPEEIQRRINDNFAAINVRLTEDELFGGVLLQPLRSIHLGSDLLYELKPPGDVRYLYLIGLIALIILLLTVSNYTNLSIIMNAGRAREIGLRKVFGASGGQVAGQFLLEAVLLSLLTLPLVALGLWWIVPRFNLLMGVELPRNLLASPDLLLLLAGLTVGIGVLAGGYPAFYLARTQVQALFRGSAGGSPTATFTTRRIVITLQFALLIGLCSLTLFVNRQLSYIQDKDLGYRKDNILYVSLNADSTRFATFRDEVLRLPNVTTVGSGTPMGLSPFNQTTYKLKGTDRVYDDAHNIYMDYRGLAQMGIQTSIPDYVADPGNAPPRLVLINQTMADRLKNRFDLTDAELIGRTIVQEPEYTNEETGEVGFPYLVAGTFSDVHLFSLRETVDPMFLTVYREPRYVYTAFIGYESTTDAAILAAVKDKYEALSLDRQFTAAFLTDNLRALYQDERRISTLCNIFSLIAFLMAIVGLVALTAYLTVLRRKEIGIRKILGAGTGRLLTKFNLEYLPLLLVALLLAVPLTWWGVSRWLEGFAYRISVSPLVFLAAVVIVAVVSGVAVSVVAWRAATTVPARVLE